MAPIPYWFEVYQEAIKEPTVLFFPGDKTIAKVEGDFVNIDILTNTDWKRFKIYDTWVVIKLLNQNKSNANLIWSIEELTVVMQK